MQITVARSGLLSTQEKPGDDLWMVRVTRTKKTGNDAGTIRRFTAVNLDPWEPPTSGVYPMLHEYGETSRSSSGWNNRLKRIEAWNHYDAFAVTQSVYDAARAFLELNLAPTGNRRAVSTPDLLRLELGDFSWEFNASSAPQAAWDVYRAAQMIL